MPIVIATQVENAPLVAQLSGGYEQSHGNPIENGCGSQHGQMIFYSNEICQTKSESKQDDTDPKSQQIARFDFEESHYPISLSSINTIAGTLPP
jgi:hypothetical protein